MADERDFVDLGLSCVDICKSLERGMGDENSNDLSGPVCFAIDRLMAWVPHAVKASGSPTHHSPDPRKTSGIREAVVNQRAVIPSFFVRGWKSDLDRLHRFLRVELPLASPTFRNLGPHARELLEVIAFFPQGISKKNADWLFPTISDVLNVLDTFCALSLTYRNDGFITMKARRRDHLCPRDPASSPLLNTMKENYLTRLSGEVLPGKPGFEETRWITTEHINLEYLLDVFTKIDPYSKSLWDACAEFVDQLHWHKPDSAGDFVKRKQLLNYSLTFWREWEDDFRVAQTLNNLSDTNRRMGLHGEGVQQAKEAYEIFEQLGSVVGRAECLINFAWSLCDLGAAGEAGLRAIDLLPAGEEPRVCEAHRALGDVYQRKGETRKAIHHFETALGIASSLKMVDRLFWLNLSLAEAFCEQGTFEEAQTRLEHAKSHAVNDTYLLARVMEQQAWVWDVQGRFEDAKSEVLRALDVFEKLGAENDVDATTQLLHQIEPRPLKPIISSGSSWPLVWVTDSEYSDSE